MNTTPLRQQLKAGLLSCSLAILAGACGLNPQNADIDINNTLPEAKSTIYQDAVSKMGLMAEIYQLPYLNIMSKDISDKTGTSRPTSGEIPNDITEMVKSTLNGIGGNIQFIPYDPSFFLNSANTGYSEFTNKAIPDLVVSGGITEFDRGLVTKGDSTEIEATSGDFGLSFEDQSKGSLAQVTLDFNMIDFQTLAAIPRIQAINGIKLHKAVKEDSFAFTVKSVTLGAKGTIKKVQGRHAAVRLLVELSMVQLLGRYQTLPYWTLLPGGQADNVVIDQLNRFYYSVTERQKIAFIQRLLYLHGYQVAADGRLNGPTQDALQQAAGKLNLTAAGIDFDTFLALYENVPIDYATRYRSEKIDGVFALLEDDGQAPLESTQTSVEQVAVSPESNTPIIDDGVITLNTDSNNYAIGDTMGIRFSVDQPMFVRLVVINSSGEVSTLFPNPYQSDSYCKPGVEYQIPPRNADFTLDIGGPVGTDKLRAVASSKPIAAEALHFTPDGEFDELKMAGLPVRAGVNINIR